MIASLPALTLPPLPVPALLASGPVTPSDDIFALLIARAAPVAPGAGPVAASGHDPMLPTAACPPADDEASVPEPITEFEPLLLQPVPLNPVATARHPDIVMPNAPLQNPSSGRPSPAQGRPLNPAGSQNADLPRPLTDTTVAVVPLPVAPVAVAPANAASGSLSALPTAPEPSALDRQMQLTPGDAALDAITQDIVASAASTGRARFAVIPERLGRVDVDVAQVAAGITVHFATSNRMATDALLTAQPLLVEGAGAHGIRLAEVQVSTGGPGAERQSGGQWGGQGNGQRPPDQVPLPIEAAQPSPHATLPTIARTRHAGRFA